MAEQEKQGGSVLAVDFGSVNTRVLLFDVVDGQYRLIARSQGPTTIGYPVDDVSVGLNRIVQDISDTSGRRFYDEDGHIITPEGIDRSGVDFFITTASAGRPIRAVLVGLLPDVSVASALRAVSDSYVEPMETIHLQDGASEEERLNKILLSRPDLIFIAGGTERGAETALMELVKVVRLALEITDKSLRPEVLYAGNSDLIPQIEATFEDLTRVLVAENIRPRIDEEHFESANLQLGHAFDDYKERASESFQRIVQMTSTGVLPTAQSYQLIAEYYAQLHKQTVLAIDSGSSVSVLVAAYGDYVDTSVGTELGTGHSAGSLLEAVGVKAIADWLPFIPERGEIRNYALNKSLRPMTVPATLRDLYFEHAFIRAGSRHLLEVNAPTWRGVKSAATLPDVDLILAGGAGLTGTGYPALNVLLMLDILQPTGITEIKSDPSGMIPALGAMAQVVPEAAAQMLENDSLEHAGTVISLSGQPRKGETALTIKITTDDETVTSEIPGGQLVQLPFPATEKLKIEVRAAGGLSIGSKRRIKATISGGTAGIIIDARGRPLNPGDTVSERAENMPAWISAVTDEPVQAIPAEWLQGDPVDDEIPEEEQGLADLLTEDEPERRGLFGRRRHRQAAMPDLGDEIPDMDALFPEEAAATPDDIDFFDMIDDDEQEAGDPDDLSSLRDLL